MPLTIPMVATTVLLLWRCSKPRYQLASTGLGMIMILFLYTFGENLEILIYLIWPGIIVLGLALQEKELRYGMP